ncbi:hypothetical protein Taro_026067 [Colocasia esculenta]|uniref:Secreted protein n=1 Tax=Colocasia esculenta TaxID=4460 RepID=A0A843VAG1_COLES|nr:hypothetical protein [Colocasia esculenta]
MMRAILPRCWSFSFCLGVLPDFSGFCPIGGCLCKPRSSSSSLFFVLVLRIRSIDLVLPEVLLESCSVSLAPRPDFSEFCPIGGCLCKPRSSSSSLFFVLVLRTRSIDLVLPDFSVLRTLDGDMFSLYFHFNRESGHHFKGRNSPVEIWGMIPLNKFVT